MHARWKNTKSFRSLITTRAVVTRGARAMLAVTARTARPMGAHQWRRALVVLVALEALAIPLAPVGALVNVGFPLPSSVNISQFQVATLDSVDFWAHGYGTVDVRGLAEVNVAAQRSRVTKSKGIREIPISFKVENVNRSKVPCASDNQSYTVRAYLVARTSALMRPERSVTVYMHGGVVAGQAVWRFDRRILPHLDYAYEMARQGHASIVLDRLGWGASFDRLDHPHGALICMGAHADILHQIIEQLRGGTYSSDDTTYKFDRIGVAAHSGGVAVIQVEAYSFGGIDAFVNVDGGFDAGFTPRAGEEAIKFGAVCARGGENKFDETPFGGWSYIFKGVERELLFYDADERVLSAVEQAHERDSCGEAGSVPQVVALNRRFLSEITVPTLLVFAEKSAVLPPNAGEDQLALYTGSSDRSLVTVPHAGHSLMLERAAPEFRRVMSEWFHDRGF